MSLAPRSVAVAVSGGVDSLYALAALHRQGLAAFALHARLLPEGQGRDPVPELERQCAKLGLPLHVADLRERFATQVIEPFVAAYGAAQTPNPCARCNGRIKFGALLDLARELGAESLATGHYARWEAHPVYGATLRQGLDHNKDQSYFLALVAAERLARAVFPLAELCKSEAVATVLAEGLDVPLPGESQEICFVTGNDYRLFLAEYGATLPGPGPIELPDGQRLGTHRGLWQYTEGQRKGLGLAWEEALYVLSKIPEQNVLRVGIKAQLDVFECQAHSLNALVDPALWPEQLLVRTRYRQAASAATVTLTGDTLTARFAVAQSPSAPGQVLAVYDTDGYVLGGAVIG